MSETKATRGASARRKGSDRARVLVVDDDERNLLALAEVLGDTAEVVTADSGEAALRHLLKGEFAVILLDVFMPGLDGYETARLIRARDQTKRIPIIFLSAVNKETEHLMRGYAMGAVDYVFKPVEPVVLRSKVAVFVDLFNMTREVRRKAEREQRLLDANLKANAERLSAEHELRLAEQRQGAIIASLPICLYLEPLDADPRIPRFVSGNFPSLTGYAFEQVQQDPSLWVRSIHPEDRERVTAAIDARGSGRGHSIEYRWRCADGGYKYFLDQSVLLRDAGDHPVEYAGTLLDVTDRKQLEEQLLQSGRLDAIGQLTGGIAHDFNNLLAAVLGGIALVERRVPLDEDQRKIVTMTRRAAEQGAELVGRLLAFARRQKLEPARVDIASLATSVTDLLTHTLGGLVSLKWQTSADLGCAYADAAQLELALMNLIINARDAMPEGGTINVIGENREISVAEARKFDFGLPGGSYIVLTVADTGCGIAPEIIQQVAEPFFTTKEVGKGTGLGLSMVYGFATQSGGTMRIESEAGKGTRVELWLPRANESGGTVAPRVEAATEANGKPTPGLRLLLVDDHEGVRATTAILLKDLGHQVTEAAGGSEVLDMLRADPQSFDCVVSDYAMPDISGTEVVRQARTIREALPALLITGYADADSISELPSDVRVLIKPFTPEQLNCAIATAVDAGSPRSPERG
jgi:PAS domain S-box-containing protein